MLDDLVEHRGSSDLIKRASSILNSLDDELLKFSQSHGLFFATQRGQPEPLPSRKLTWGSPILKYLILQVDDLNILSFKVTLIVALDDYGARYRREEVVVSGASAEDIKQNLHTNLAQGLALADSWKQSDLYPMPI